MNKYVYLVFSYAEHGPDDIVATLDRDKIVAAYESISPSTYGRDDSTEALRAILKSHTDEELVEGKPLGTGWGGFVVMARPLHE